PRAMRVTMAEQAKTPEERRLEEDARRERNWKRWGPYLAERQWGTVREDYSPDGTSWDYFPHDHARSRAYRWGEDGLLGITDREGRLCFALALWNGKDPILMLVEALERYHHFYGESLQVECPTGSGHRIAGQGRAGPLSASCGPVRPDADGRRPCATGTTRASATIRGATSSRSRSTSVVTAAAASARATRAGRRLPS